MDDDIMLEKVKENKAKHAAFSDFIENGMDFVRKHYPNQVAFVLKNMDREFNDVILEIEEEFNFIVGH